MTTINRHLKVVLAHDSLTQRGGAERVLEAMHELYPDAPVLVLVADPKIRDNLKNWDVRTSWLQPWYRMSGKFPWLLPFIPAALATMEAPPCEVLISSSSMFMKALRPPKNSIHMTYCHTPPRFIWSEPDYVNQEAPLLLRPLVHLFLHWARQWDFKVAQRVNFIIANSREVQRRIKEFYQRDSTIIYPFVDMDFWKPTLPKQNHFLAGGRLQSHKGNEQVIEAFNELGLELHVAGLGRAENYLRSIAKPNIKFLGRVSDEQLRDEYSGALGFIFPPFEDFGLMSLEAAACGTASLGLAAGGSLETIVPGVTGELIDQTDSVLIIEKIKSWNANKYDQQSLRAHAGKFSKQIFLEQLSSFVNEHSR